MELKRPEVLEVIQNCLVALNAERGEDEQIAINEETPLLGGESQLDSLAFVSLVSDLEERLRALGYVEGMRWAEEAEAAPGGP